MAERHYTPAVPLPNDRARVLGYYRDGRSFGQTPEAAIGAVKHALAVIIADDVRLGYEPLSRSVRRYAAAVEYQAQIIARYSRLPYWRLGKLTDGKRIDAFMAREV